MSEDFEMVHPFAAAVAGAADAAEQLCDLSEWFDEHNAGRSESEQMLARAIKVGEENGEMVAEIIGMTGQNPRKGVISDKEKVIKEALDVALTALGFVEHMLGNSGDSFERFHEHIAVVHARMQGAPSADEIPSDVKIDKFLDRDETVVPPQ
jgi:hypothetical protein